MFTGIVETMGVLRAMEPVGGDSRLRIEAREMDMSDVAIGDSIAVNGVCLTATEIAGDGFAADVSGETLDATTLGGLRPGARVNLEKALTPATRLGGHLVSGHVDGVATVAAVAEDARSTRVDIDAPEALARYIARKGSVTVDGISLTVNEVSGRRFSLNIVPHTQQVTTSGEWCAGTRVNLEVDIIARYLERLLLGDRAADPQAEQGVTLALLAENGFLNR